jgi:hypothetical protein
MTFLRDRARGGVPQNVEFTIRRWAEGVTFATLERGVVLRVEEESALDRVLGLPDLRPLLVRRLSPTDVLLKEEPRDRRLLAALRAQGIHLQGP